MSQIILDFGSGNTCRNNLELVRRMIDELKAVDTGKHKIIIKWQLFKNAGANIPLDHKIFSFAYNYAKILGYKTTASVFDKSSLDFLLNYEVLFVKIANRRDLDWLIGCVPRKMPVYVSISSSEELDKALYCNHIINQEIDRALYCVSQYPAETKQYRVLGYGSLKHGFSDHTIGLELFKEIEPRLWEKHYKLSDSTGLDAGPFAITPEELREIL
jgi:sialic acid synthase SpsE